METDPLVSTVIIILIAIFDFFVALAKSAFEHASENELRARGESEGRDCEKVLAFIDKIEQIRAMESFSKPGRAFG